MTKRLLHLISVRRAAAILLVLSLCAGGVYLAQTTSTTTWPNNAAGIQNLTAGLPVSNGQWVVPGQVIWSQHTTQGIGTANIHTSANILQPTTGAPSGTSLITTTWDVSCNFSASGGFGTGFTVTTAGWLQSATTLITTGGFAQGSDYANLYVLSSMPTGGGTSGCVNTLVGTQIGMLLMGAPTGSSYPVSFVGTTSTPVSPWAIPGFTSIVNIGNPAAGVDWSFTIGGLGAGGGGSRTCVLGAFATLTAGVGVANRTAMLQFVFNGGTGTPQLDYIAGTAQTASQIVNYSFSPGANATSLNTTGSTFFQIVPINNGTPICFNAGLSTPAIRSNTTNIQAADQWSNVGLIVQIQQDNN